MERNMIRITVRVASGGPSECAKNENHGTQNNGNASENMATLTYPAQWLCDASPVLNAMLTEGWMESREQAVELLQFDRDAVIDFLALLTAYKMKSFNEDLTASIPKRGLHMIIRRAGPIVDYLQSWVLRDFLRDMVLRTPSIGAVAAYETVLADTDPTFTDWPYSVYKQLGDEPAFGEIKGGALSASGVPNCIVCGTKTLVYISKLRMSEKSDRCINPDCKLSKVRRFHCTVANELKLAAKEGMRSSTLLQLMEQKLAMLDCVQVDN